MAIIRCFENLVIIKIGVTIKSVELKQKMKVFFFKLVNRYF